MGKSKIVGIILPAIFIFLSAELACAIDFGKYGATFEIKEEGFLAMIERKLKSLDIEAMQKKLQQKAKEAVSEPKPVEGIKRVTKGREFIYDPTYILMEDIYLPSGELLHKAGTRVNPLDHISLEQKLVFLDGKDREQVKWLKEYQEGGELKEEDKLILVSGRPFDLEKELRMPVYFDQFGEITKKFGIKQVPAIAWQEDKEDKVLSIREIMID